VKTSFEEQTSLNEVLCAENCVARWLWKGGSITGKGAVHWDIESVNTCPENYLLQPEGDIVVEAAGLYELSLAFFSKKRRPSVKVYLNEQLSVSAAPLAKGRCGHDEGDEPHAASLFKVSAVEFIVIPAKGVLNLNFTAEGLAAQGLVPAEGFMGLRKL